MSCLAVKSYKAMSGWQKTSTEFMRRMHSRANFFIVRKTRRRTFPSLVFNRSWILQNSNPTILRRTRMNTTKTKLCLARVAQSVFPQVLSASQTNHPPQIAFRITTGTRTKARLLAGLVSTITAQSTGTIRTKPKTITGTASCHSGISTGDIPNISSQTKTMS